MVFASAMGDTSKLVTHRLLPISATVKLVMLIIQLFGHRKFILRAGNFMEILLAPIKAPILKVPKG